MNRYQQQFPSAYESVAIARRAVGRFAATCGYGAAAISDIVLAVGEACSNSVEHGHVERGDFTVVCSFTDSILRMEIADGGRGFDEQKLIVGAEPIESVGRGRGFIIMRALMDAVECRRGTPGMTVVLVKRLLASGVAESGGELTGLDADRCGQTG